MLKRSARRRFFDWWGGRPPEPPAPPPNPPRGPSAPASVGRFPACGARGRISGTGFFRTIRIFDVPVERPRFLLEKMVGELRCFLRSRCTQWPTRIKTICVWGPGLSPPCFQRMTRTNCQRRHRRRMGALALRRIPETSRVWLVIATSP